MTDYNRDNEQYTPENDGRPYDDIYSSQPEQQPINQTAEQSTSEASTVQKVQETTQQYAASQAEQQPLYKTHMHKLDSLLLIIVLIHSNISNLLIAHLTISHSQLKQLLQRKE